MGKVHFLESPGSPRLTNERTKTMTTKAIFQTILDSSLCRIDGPTIDLCDTIIELCNAINEEEGTNWSLGEHGEFTLDSFLIGAYWSLTEWHAGQWSEEYAALCAIGSIFSPGMTGGPEPESSEEIAFEMVGEYFSAKEQERRERNV